MRRSLWLLGALSLALLLMSAAGIVAAKRTAVEEANPSSWTLVYADSFDVADPIWSISDEYGTGYEWGISAYTRTVGSSPSANAGLWAAGGGRVGTGLTWPTDTYTNGMLTIAIAGPITVTGDVAAVRLTAEVLNESVDGDHVYVELSRDGVNPLAWTNIAVDGNAWQTVTRTTSSVSGGDAVWVFMLFRSDASDVTTGPIVDDVQVEVLQSYEVFLPLLRLDPTPTPLPIYHDDFSEPASGWFVGDAIRYNPYTGDEVVAEMSYGDGIYEIYVPLDFRGGGPVDTWFVWPAELAPLPPGLEPLPTCYSVETRARFNVGEDYSPWWAHWGLVFGSDAARTDLYTFQINANHLLGMLRFENYTYPGNRYKDGQNIEHAIYQWPDTEPYEHWSKDEYASPSYAYHTLRVDVNGDTASFYLNGARVAVANIAGMPREHVGLIGGSYEVTPVEIHFDYFHFDATCAGP